MKNYWSCSKFADWLRGAPKPFAATQKEWRAWEKNHGGVNKFRFWLAENCLDYLQSIICWPMTSINNIRLYLQNRWVIKTHALTSTLERGRWHEFDTRLLYAAFDELVNFVEIELAWMFMISPGDEYKKCKLPWYCTYFKIGQWRNPEAGQAYLAWASNLKNDEYDADTSDPNYGLPTEQALVAQEVTKLYQWWKEERPNQPDPIDQDTNMLIRLIQIRQDLWT